MSPGWPAFAGHDTGWLMTDQAWLKTSPGANRGRLQFDQSLYETPTEKKRPTMPAWSKVGL